jgi:hypothetical protein
LRDPDALISTDDLAGRLGERGGGISATTDLFLLHQLGFDDLTLYDGSMGEGPEPADRDRLTPGPTLYCRR